MVALYHSTAILASAKAPVPPPPAGYLLEQSLSVDNLFVFVLVFSYFKTPPAAQVSKKNACIAHNTLSCT